MYSQKNLESNWSGAVVMLLSNERVIFIQRSETMPTHKGEVGFMGGHKQKGETCPKVTALREYAEESGFGQETISVLGLLRPVVTSKHRVIIPVVARLNLSLKTFLKGVKSNGEWSNLIVVDLNQLGLQQAWSKGYYCLEKDFPVYFACLHKSFSQYLYPTNKSSILWGASAKMVLDFLNLERE